MDPYRRHGGTVNVSQPYAYADTASQRPREYTRRDLSFDRSLKLTASWFWAGVVDAMSWPKTLITIYLSETIRVATVKVLLTNAVLFVGSFVIFQQVFQPLLHWTFGSVRQRAELHLSSLDPKYQYISSSQIFNGLYLLLWVYPTYGVSQASSSALYQSVADRAFTLQTQSRQSSRRQQREAPDQSASTSSNPTPIPSTQASAASRAGTSGNLANAIYRTIVLGIFMASGSLLGIVPIVGKIFGFFVLCWATAYYCFEYKWIHQGMTLDRRTEYLEKHWAYFLGFGLPLTFATYFTPTLVSFATFALLFPCYIIMGTAALPLPTTPESTSSSQSSSPPMLSRWIPQRLPVFYAPYRIADLAIYLLRSLLGGGVFNEPAARTQIPLAETRQDILRKRV